jgi:ssDNA-binding Zn-finger/Zn-ribbon topoisomerase 1
MYVLEIVGLKYRPIIVTSSESADGIEVRCPVCNKISPIKKNELDSEITCPQEGCNTQLKVNPFVIQHSMGD